MKCLVTLLCLLKGKHVKDAFWTSYKAFEPKKKWKRATTESCIIPFFGGFFPPENAPFSLLLQLGPIQVNKV